MKYDVVSTDYENYAIVNSHSKFGSFFSLDWAYVLTREPLEQGTKKWRDMNNFLNYILEAEMPGCNYKNLVDTNQGSFCDYNSIFPEGFYDSPDSY